MLSVFRSIPYPTAAVRLRSFPAIPDHAAPCGTNTETVVLLLFHCIPYPTPVVARLPGPPALPCLLPGVVRSRKSACCRELFRSAASYPITAFMQAFYI